MKVIRFVDISGRVQLGELLGQLGEGPNGATPAGPAKARLIEGDLFGAFTVTDDVAEVDRLLPPVEPVNIIAIGLNYRRHAEESGASIPDEPLVFSKLTTSLTGPRDAIVLPLDAPDEVDYEAELAVVIGKTARHVREADALKHVLGYACANDVSARDCQKRRDKQWTRAKGFDTFCPLGPCLLIDSKVDPNALAIRSMLNGKLMQDSDTADMIFTVPKLIGYLSRQFTLRPGTVIVTGTPEGVGCARKPPVFLRDGDTITVEIDGIGKLVNPVRGENLHRG